MYLFSICLEMRYCAGVLFTPSVFFVCIEMLINLLVLAKMPEGGNKMGRCKDCKTEIKIRTIEQTRGTYNMEKLLKIFQYANVEIVEKV